jgi:hypothetical protein
MPQNAIRHARALYGQIPIEKRRGAMSSPEQIKVALEDEKSGLRERIVRAVGVHTVVLFAISDSREGEALDLGGTGTLVVIANSHYLLTAAHVWEERLKSARDVGITLKEDINHCCRIHVSGLVASGLPKPRSWNEWGPDLVFLKLPPNHVAGIEAFQSFYRLDMERVGVKLCGIEVRILMGTPRECGKFTRTHAEVNINGHFADINAQTCSKGEFDYIDLKEDVSLPGVPRTFGGVSGGGLWRVHVFESPESSKIDWRCFLEGMAFHQSDLVDNHRIIRCQGPQTIQLAAKGILTC